MWTLRWWGFSATLCQVEMMAFRIQVLYNSSLCRPCLHLEFPFLNQFPVFHISSPFSSIEHLNPNGELWFLGRRKGRSTHFCNCNREWIACCNWIVIPLETIWELFPDRGWSPSSSPPSFTFHAFHVTLFPLTCSRSNKNLFLLCCKLWQVLCI